MEEKKERAVLVGLNADIFDEEQTASWESLDELADLLETAGGECICKMLQSRAAPDARTFLGEGKCKELCETAQNFDADLILFDNELSPSQMRTIEEMSGRTVLDRSALILDIFAQRARTGEGKLQVELAQYQYLLPRLSGMGHALSRLGGGIGTRGPGESKLETDRRHIRRRIDHLRAELEKVRRVRAVQRRQRKKAELPLVAIVGYTNAGKSTLLNTLTDAGIEANDRLFDTLDPTTRKLRISETQEILLSDTVGFIRKLPHHLVSAFKATLEELSYADLLLHVVDVSSDHWEEQVKTVQKVITELDAASIPQILVCNKVDLCTNPDLIPGGADCVRISAKYGHGMQALLQAIDRGLGRGKHHITLLIPYTEGALTERLFRECKVHRNEYTEAGTRMEITCDDIIYGQMKQYEVSQDG